MNSGQIYAKTPIGDEAVRQSTRVVQRNLRLVLVQVDGKLSVGELGEKIGNMRLVENAIAELEKGGFIVPIEAAAAAWESPSKSPRKEQVSAISQFSTFGPVRNVSLPPVAGGNSQFSSFGKPVLPVPQIEPREDLLPPPEPVRRGMSASRWLLVLSGLVFLGLLVVLVYPYDRHRESIAASLSEILGQPVSVGAVALRFQPQPRLELAAVEIGEGKIASLSLDHPWRLVFGGAADIEHIVVSGMTLPARQLDALPFLVAGTELPLPSLNRAEIVNLSIDAGYGLVFDSFNGRLEFIAGRFYEGQLENQTRSLLVRFKPDAAGLQLAIEGRAWPLPGLAGDFPAMQAHAVLKNHGLEVHEFDTTFLGGLLKGNWSLDWQDGVAMRGKVAFERLDLAQLSKLVPSLGLLGELSGNLVVDGKAPAWQGIWRSVQGRGTLQARRGELRGVDLGEAARRGDGAVVRSGSTRFDELDADIDVTADAVQLRNIRLEAGVLAASGQVSVAADKQVTGRMMMTARSSVALVRVPLLISGSLPDLTVTAGR